MSTPSPAGPSGDDIVEVVEVLTGGVVELTWELDDPFADAEVVSVVAGAVGPQGPLTDLDDLADVEVEPGDVGVLTRHTGDPVARFEPLPDPPTPPPVPARYTQIAAALRWQHVHNLGYRPHYDVRDSDGRIHHPENVEHPVPGVVSEIVFGVPMTGTADPS